MVLYNGKQVTSSPQVTLVPVDVVQSKGNSVTAVMSQKATTDAINEAKFLAQSYAEMTCAGMIAQSTGNNEEVVMSQKAVTIEFENRDKTIANHTKSLDKMSSTINKHLESITLNRRHLDSHEKRLTNLERHIKHGR